MIARLTVSPILSKLVIEEHGASIVIHIRVQSPVECLCILLLIDEWLDYRLHRLNSIDLFLALIFLHLITLHHHD